jgi:hypothetical protein
MRRNNRHREYESAGFEDRGGAHNLAFLIAGIGIGSAIALLLAPNSGEEIRHSIGRGYRKTVKKIGRHTDDLRERAEDLLEHAHHLREHGSRLFHFGESVRRKA